MNELIAKAVEQLKKWKSLRMSTLGRVTILKTYTLSKLWYRAYVEVIGTKQIQRLYNVLSWFLWSREEAFNASKRYTPKMSWVRACLPVGKGGLGLWDLDQRFRSFKIYIAERARLSNCEFLYFGIWGKLSQAAKDVGGVGHALLGDEWTHSDLFATCWYESLGLEINEGDNRDLLLTLKDIYGHLVKPCEQKLSSSQAKLGLDLKLNWNKIFTNASKLPLSTKPKSILWGFLTKTLPCSKIELKGGTNLTTRSFSQNRKEFILKLPRQFGMNGSPANSNGQGNPFFVTFKVTM